MKSRAYVFHASSDAAAASSALANIEHLRTHFPTPYDIFLMVRDPDDELRSRVAHWGAILIPGALPLATDNVARYENSLIQRICFRLHQWRPQSHPPPSRIVILDADCSTQSNLDTLFTLPEVDRHAAPPPRAYWIDRHAVDSTWMLVTLSGRLWNRIDDALASLGPGIYDMDPDQVLFGGSSLLLLPGSYVTMNDHRDDLMDRQLGQTASST